MGNGPTLPRSLRNLLRGAKDPYVQLSKIRREVSTGLYPALVSWIPNLAQKNRYFLGGRFPTNIRVLRRELRILLPVSCASEIIWCSLVLSHHTMRLAEFCSQSQIFETHLLSGNYEEAESDLNEIEGRFGYSLWSIESRFALLQLWKGLEGQKAFAGSLKES